MSAPVSAPSRRTSPTASGGRRFVPRIVVGSIFVALVVVIAAAAAWPIYRSGALVLLVAVSAAIAAAIAALARRRRWGAGGIALALTATVAVLGVPLAVPSRLGGPLEVLRGLGDVAAGLVLGWKDLITVDLPVGSYRNLLVPALVVFLVGTAAALLLSWRQGRWAYAAVPVALGMISFGLFFGRPTVSAPLRWGPLTLWAPLETTLGAAGLVVCLLWLAWRSSDERMRSLQRAAVSSGVRVSRRPSRADRRRTALGAGMIALAIVAAVVVVPYAARGAERDVLRAAVGPDVDVSRSVSPLADYRNRFADDRADDVLFTVDAEGPLPDRIRLATLDSYDGEIYRSGGTGAVDESRFERVPSTLDAGAGDPVEVRITIGDLSGIWMPTVGRLESVAFSGDRASALADSFYYRAAAGAGVQTAGGGLEPGDAYDLRAVEPRTPDLTALDAPGGVDPSTETPTSLRTWVDEHVSGSGGAALAGLVELLRDRGYLSHALSIGAEPPAWMSGLSGYGFQPSAAGHSLARIDALFERLLERESDPQAAASGNYVAAVGDDEQFAVAVSLIAQELGFPARVVVGAVLSSPDPDVRTCEGGICRAPDLAAWAEVQSADGAWVPVDVTPQFEQSPSLELAEQQDPLNVTEVRPDTVDEVVPPDPVQEDTAREDPPDDAAGWDLAWLWAALRVAGVVLLVLAIVLGPLVVIALAKILRRRGRRLLHDPAARIAGGWDEYVDAVVDAGAEPVATLTRSEAAQLYGSVAAARLAAGADRAIFSDAGVTAIEADAYWTAVELERRRIVTGRGIWRRLAATVSLRSFIRHLARPDARARSAEGGKRRAVLPAR